MVTLKDIAAEAGVSITTVSNVVHNRKSRVSEKKVAKIWEIIEREHYVPSMSARSLANDQSAIIAMVTYITPRTTGSTVSDPFMSSVAASVEQRTREAGYYLMLRSAESVAALEGLIDLVQQAGATVVGAGIAVEKAFQPGGERIRAKGVRVESLARVKEMHEGEIVFC